VGLKRRLISTLLSAAVAAGIVAAPSPARGQPQNGSQTQAPPPPSGRSDQALSPAPPAPARQPADPAAAAPRPSAGTAAPTTAPTTAPSPPPGPDVAGDLQRLAGILSGANARQFELDQAAAQLASRESERADSILRDVLFSGSREAKLAVARSVADDPVPPPDFVDPLADMLAGEQQRTWADAAAQALAGYRGNGAALGHLRRIATDANQPPAARLAAIRALGRVVEIGSAETLLDLLGPPNERRDVRDAAADALADMTGLREYGRDPRRWAQWWQQENAANNPDGWRARVLEARAARFERASRRLAALVAGLEPRLFAQYQAADTKEKRSAVLLDMLSAAEPDVRAIGARIVTTVLTGREEVADAVRDRLVAMVGDAEPRVREEVVRTLFNINYSGALSALLTQLAQERDERVKLPLINAVGAIEDPAAAGPLLTLLNDPSPAVVTAALRAMERVGRRLPNEDPALAAKVAARLRAIALPPAGRNAPPPPPEDLRILALNALAALKDPAMLEQARRLLAEPSVPVRTATLRLLGDLGDARAGDAISDTLRGERDPAVRQLALDALGRAGGLGYAETLFAYMQPGTEPDPVVREKAWQAFRAAMGRPTTTNDQLAAAHLMFKADPDRHVHVARALAERLRQSDLAQWAMQQQNIGDDLMKLHEPPGPRPEEAAACYEQALTYWLQNKGEALTIEELTRKVLKARLAAGQWAQATAFAQNAVARTPSAQDVVGPLIRKHADELRSPPLNDPKGALALIESALKMNPPLEKRHQDDLRQIRNDIGGAADGGNGAPPQQ
jgi:HEAT repeat protein